MMFPNVNDVVATAINRMPDRYKDGAKEAAVAEIIRHKPAIDVGLVSCEDMIIQALENQLA